MADKIIIKNTTSEANLDNIQPADVLNGEILLVRELDKEHLYCKNSNGEISKIHRITDAGEFLSAPTSTYQAIDLGLPSGLLWANKNIGAETEEDAGLYFQWGDTQGYTAEQVGVDKQFAEDLSDCKWYTNPSFTKYNNSDGLTTLESTDDAATQIMGADWRMPTEEEFKELVDNTDVYIISTDGEEIANTYTGSSSGYFTFPVAETMKGMKFYRKDDHSKYIFVPAGGNALSGSVRVAGVVGYLRSSSRSASNVGVAYSLFFYASSGYGNVSYASRHYGIGVRGVKSQQ